MRNILLVCNAGMSTSILVKKMQEHAEKVGYKCSIKAQPSASIDEKEKFDIVLLGPQIRHQLKKIKESLAPTPVELIDTVAYGMMDGKSVLEKAMKILGDAWWLVS